MIYVKVSIELVAPMVEKKKKKVTQDRTSAGWALALRRWLRWRLVEGAENVVAGMEWSAEGEK